MNETALWISALIRRLLCCMYIHIHIRTYVHAYVPLHLLLSFAPDTLYCRYSSNGRNVGYQVCEEDPAFLTHEAPHRGCFGSYQVEENGTLTALEQSCIDQWFGFCNFSGCRLSTQTRDTTLHTTFVYCCCNSNECNGDSPDFHPDHPIYPVQPPHEPGKC